MTTAELRALAAESVEAKPCLEAALGGPLTIPSLVEAVRLNRGVSRADMARALKVTPQHLCDVEKGRRTLSPSAAYRWGETLGYAGITWLEVAARGLCERELAKVGQKASVALTFTTSRSRR